MTPATFDKKKLNKVYIQLAKKYHPDLSNGTLSAKDCADKFKKLVAAHELLKDDHQRRIWDIRHGVGEYAYAARPHSTGEYPAYCYRQPHGASSWQGQQFHRTYPSEEENGYWSAERKANFNANMSDNRFFLLKAVCGFVLFIAVCELATMFEVSDRRTARLDQISRDTEALYARILANFDLGNSAEDRIRRFIDHRQRTLDLYPNTSYMGMTTGTKTRARSTDDKPDRPAQ